VIDLTGTHTYLLANLLGLPAVLAAFVFLRDQRRLLLLAGMVEVAHSAPLVFFQGRYWAPERLFGVAWGLEDILVCFSLGCLVWAAAYVPLRRRLTINLAVPIFVRRIFAVAALTIPAAAIVWLLGVGVMGTLIVVMILTAAALLVMRPGLWRLSLSAVLLYPPYYVLVLFVGSWIGTDFFSIWDGPELWGPVLFGLPVDEIVFVYVFSLCYPLIFGFASGVTIRPAGRRRP